MPYKTGSWGKQAKERSKRRRVYFRKYAKRKYKSYRRPDISSARGLGIFGEDLGLKILDNSKLKFNVNYDLIWKGKKIEVKTAKPTKHRCKRKGKKDVYIHYAWKFNIKKQSGEADYFLFICVDRGGIVKRIYLIPSEGVKNKNTISLGLTNKSKKFREYQIYEYSLARQPEQRLKP